LEEVQNDFFEKEEEFTKKQKKFSELEKQLRSELHEASTDIDKFRDLYDSSIKNIKNFKSDNSEKFNTMMQETEVLRREIADYKIAQNEL
jgi:hypothetical protein